MRYFLTHKQNTPYFPLFLPQKFIISHRIKITIEKMDQLIFEKRAISSKKYTYLQYSLASALSKS